MKTLMYNDTFFLLAFICLTLSSIMLLYFIYRRIRWLLTSLSGKKTGKPKLSHSVKKLVFLLFFLSISLTLVFSAFFLQAYQSFTREIPVAEIHIQPSEQTRMFSLTLIRENIENKAATLTFEMAGDQWMIEADILKWDNWLNFTGLETRYRLTRIRGRYRDSASEKTEPTSIYTLDPNENHPLWRGLYIFGHRLPFVNSVYGNAAYHDGDTQMKFELYVTNSGLIIKRKQ